MLVPRLESLNQWPSSSDWTHNLFTSTANPELSCLTGTKLTIWLPDSWSFVFSKMQETSKCRILQQNMWTLFHPSYFLCKAYFFRQEGMLKHDGKQSRTRPLDWFLFIPPDPVETNPGNPNCKFCQNQIADQILPKKTFAHHQESPFSFKKNNY